jgi:DNA-directed RNA polymerase specialized sigma24 family protein
MSEKLIDWVDARGRTWGDARRKLDTGQEKWPESVWSRIQDGVPPTDYRDQKFPEVFTEEVLRFNIAVQKLPNAPRGILYTHYVITIPARKKASMLKISHTTYYARLARAHIRVANVLDYA